MHAHENEGMVCALCVVSMFGTTFKQLSLMDNHKQPLEGPQFH